MATVIEATSIRTGRRTLLVLETQERGQDSRTLLVVDPSKPKPSLEGETIAAFAITADQAAELKRNL